MEGKIGDTIVMRVKTRRVAPAGRQGTIEQVLGPGRFLVRWGDGRATTVAPLPDAFEIVPAGKTGSKAKKAASWPPPPKPPAGRRRAAPKKKT
ncbi:MAG: DUF1918 domain-containing protein [Thermoleophilia bacterium]|nr:DUF1918 domain-containing protein [Thermoleophilia bacterium]